MNVLLSFLVALIKAILPSVLQHLKPTAEEGASATGLRTRLQRQVRRTWRGAAGALLLGLLTACTTHSIYVPDGTPVRLRETVEDVAVWVLDAQGTPVPSHMDLPEGWYVLPMPSDDDIDSD